MDPSRFTFGTYRLQGERLSISLKMAANALKERGATSINIDTAQLYLNEREVCAIAKTLPLKANITTKISKRGDFHQTVAFVNKSLDIFNGDVHTVLLHHPVHQAAWEALESFRVSVGVSNHTVADLQKLLSYAKIKPSINQVEFHPFLDGLQELLAFCKAQGIRVQGHTLLAKGKFFGDPDLCAIAAKHKRSVAQIMLRWAYQHDVDLCISTCNVEHLNEDLDIVSFALSNEDMIAIDALHTKFTHRFYNRSSPIEKPVLGDLNTIADTLRQDLQAMADGQDVSPMCNAIPKALSVDVNGINTKELAMLLFPHDAPSSSLASAHAQAHANAHAQTQSSSSSSSSSSALASAQAHAQAQAQAQAEELNRQRSYSKFRLQMTLLRQYRENSRRESAHSGRTCSLAKHKSSIGSTIAKAVAEPTPMPVEIPPVDDMKPFALGIAIACLLLAGGPAPGRPGCCSIDRSG